jgi:hypothetical protein
MTKVYDVIVARNITESCTMLIEAENRAAAIMLAHERSRADLDLVWEQDDTPSAGAEYCVTRCELQGVIGS